MVRGVPLSRGCAHEHRQCSPEAEEDDRAWWERGLPVQGPAATGVGSRAGRQDVPSDSGGGQSSFAGVVLSCSPASQGQGGGFGAVLEGEVVPDIVGQIPVRAAHPLGIERCVRPCTT